MPPTPSVMVEMLSVCAYVGGCAAREDYELRSRGPLHPMDRHRGAPSRLSSSPTIRLSIPVLSPMTLTSIIAAKLAVGVPRLSPPLSPPPVVLAPGPGVTSQAAGERGPGRALAGRTGRGATCARLETPDRAAGAHRARPRGRACAGPTCRPARSPDLGTAPPSAHVLTALRTWPPNFHALNLTVGKRREPYENKGEFPPLKGEIWLK